MMKERIKGMQHIGLPTNDMKATIAFYESLGFEIATRHDCRARIDRLSYGFCGLIVAFDLSKKRIGKLLFIIECRHEFEPFSASEERGFGPLVVENEIDTTLL